MSNDNELPSSESPEISTGKTEQVEVHCEGCAVTYRTRLTSRGRVSVKHLPGGWFQSGRSRKHPGSIASWCPDCGDSVYHDWDNPSAAEVTALAKALR